ncbi:MAG: CDP-diacylglycerol--glycerol-3-phosphate 3-phosphatidyltransferase, partial [Candidatus Theseobacter exili]|nr:CDP-diacylglycerol--glycerol-3-phosphate 3-phosphatidyltransferase [Candidatus Theseobacter exili]
QSEFIPFFFGFILAFLIGITDFFDGYLARKYGKVTLFGKLLDPVADKIFVIAALLFFVQIDYFPAWILLIIVVRELAVTELRIFSLKDGTEIEVSKLGKWKALCQYLLVFYLGVLRCLDLFFSSKDLPFFDSPPPFKPLTILLGVIVAVVTAASMIEYFLKSNLLKKT